MKRSVIGFFLTFCFLLSSGYREICAPTIEQGDMNLVRSRSASLIVPISADNDTQIIKTDAAEIEEADDDPTSLKKHLENPCSFNTLAILNGETTNRSLNCRPHSSLLSCKWYLVFEVFRV